jgi:thioesterase domain-containing protein
VLPIRERGSEPPFFLIHPGGGLSWCYMPLARYVPEDVPLYGIQAAGLDGVAEPAGSVAQMAAAYADLIRGLRPSGPYRLLGWSFGGVVAHEVACRLQAAGGEVDALVIMDASAEAGRAVAGAESTGADDRLDRTIAVMREELAHVLGGVTDDELKALARVYHTNEALQADHEPSLFEGGILLLSAGRDREERPEARQRARTWQPYVSGEISEAVLPCAHRDMVRPDMLASAWDEVAAWMAAEPGDV